MEMWGLLGKLDRMVGKGMGGFLGHWAVEGVIGSVEYECV